MVVLGPLTCSSIGEISDSWHQFCGPSLDLLQFLDLTYLKWVPHHLSIHHLSMLYMLIQYPSSVERDIVGSWIH
jgi:hypothetical protein